MQTALKAVHTAIYQRLSQDTALMGKVSRVYDKVSATATFPYCSVGEPSVASYDTKSDDGEEITMVLHTWSQYNGHSESYDILNLMLQALTKEPFVIEGFSFFMFDRQQMQVITDIDGETYHGILRVRFRVFNQ